MKSLLTALVLATGSLALALPAAGQTDFPNKSINLVVPFAAGGSTDLVGRVVAQAMSEQLG